MSTLPPDSGASTPAVAPVAPMAPVSRENRPMIVGPESPEPPYPIELFGPVTEGFKRGSRELGIPTANLPKESHGPLYALADSSHKDKNSIIGIYYGFARVHATSSTPLPTAPPTAAGTPSMTPALTPSASTTDLSAAAKASAKSPKKKFSGHTLHQLTVQAIEAMDADTAPYPEHEDVGKRRLPDEDNQVWPMVMSVGWNPYYKNEDITAEVHIMHPFKNNFYGHDMSVLVLGYIRPELNYVSKEALIEDIKTDAKVALRSLAREKYAAYAQAPFLTGTAVQSREIARTRADECRGRRVHENGLAKH